MFRPAFNVARRTTLVASRQTAKRFNSSAPVDGGDTKWALGAIAVTLPALAYLLAPPDKKAHAHKVVHQTAASAGLAEEKDDDEHPTEIHGPDSRASAKSQDITQTPQEQREQAERQPTKQAKSDPSSTNAGVFDKQAGVSNTETKHKVPSVKTDGENPSAKASGTVDPTRERGKEKEGPIGGDDLKSDSKSDAVDGDAEEDKSEEETDKE